MKKLKITIIVMLWLISLTVCFFAGSLVSRMNSNLRHTEQIDYLLSRVAEETDNPAVKKLSEEYSVTYEGETFQVILKHFPNHNYEFNSLPSHRN